MSRIVFAAGGTAGHFFPAEALGAALAARGHEIALITDPRTGRRESGIFAGRPQHVVRGAGLAGRGLGARLHAAAALSRGTIAARRALRQLRAEAVIGFGGYPSVPPLLAAASLGRERPLIVLHEGNAVLGQANAQLARFADRLATSYAETRRLPRAAGARAALVGMPVRDEILAHAASPYPCASEPIELLVWGGSLGARIFAETVPAALAGLDASLRGRLRVTQQVRPEDLAGVRAAYARAAIPAHCAPFLDQVGRRLAAAALVIGRAGGSSVAELAAVGRPAILVPLPIAASDEQGANAAALSAAGGAWLMRQPAFTPSLLGALLQALLGDPPRLARAARAARSLAGGDAAGRLADLVEDALARRGRRDPVPPVEEFNDLIHDPAGSTP